MVGEELVDQNLCNADFSGAQAARCRFINCDLRGANMAGAQFVNCQFIDCQMEGIDRTGTQFVRCQGHQGSTRTTDSHVGQPPAAGLTRKPTGPGRQGSRRARSVVASDGAVVVNGSLRNSTIHTSRGPAVIVDDDQGDGSPKITWGPQAYSARVLQVERLAAQVTIEPVQEPEINVKMTGQQAEIDLIKVRLDGDTLTVIGDPASGSQGVHLGGAQISSIGGGMIVGGSVHMQGGSIVISGGSANDSLPQVVIEVPVGTSVVTRDIQGSLKMGDTDGLLDIDQGGDTDLQIGRVGNTRIHRHGSGDIDIDEVNGSLVINKRGSGDVCVDDGRVSNLSVDKSGSGDVSFRGRATDADLRGSGSGDIKIKHVKNRPHTSSTGHGDIIVKNWR